MVARSHQDMEVPSHTNRRMAIPSTAVGADITGTATIGMVDGTADMEAGATEVGAAMEAEVAMEAADDTFSLSGSIRSLTFRVELDQGN